LLKKSKQYQTIKKNVAGIANRLPANYQTIAMKVAMNK